MYWVQQRQKLWTTHLSYVVPAHIIITYSTEIVCSRFWKLVITSCLLPRYAPHHWIEKHYQYSIQWYVHNVLFFHQLWLSGLSSNGSQHEDSSNEKGMVFHCDFSVFIFWRSRNQISSLLETFSITFVCFNLSWRQKWKLCIAWYACYSWYNIFNS